MFKKREIAEPNALFRPQTVSEGFFFSFLLLLFFFSSFFLLLSSCFFLLSSFFFLLSSFYLLSLAHSLFSKFLSLRDVHSTLVLNNSNDRTFIGVLEQLSNLALFTHEVCNRSLEKSSKKNNTHPLPLTDVQ